MQVHHGTVYVGMPHQLLYAGDVHPIFQQVGSITMTQHVRMHFLENARLLCHCFYYPLYPTLAVPAIEILALGVGCAFKEIGLRMRCADVLLNASDQMSG